MTRQHFVLLIIGLAVFAIWLKQRHGSDFTSTSPSGNTGMSKRFSIGWNARRAFIELVLLHRESMAMLDAFHTGISINELPVVWQLKDQ